MKMRLVILVSHPIQYCAPLYRELALRGNIDLHVVYLSDAGARTYYDESFNQTFSWDIPLLDGYAYTVLRPGLNLDGRGFLMRSAGRLEETLAGLTPDALLLYGYASKMNWQALRWAARHGCRVLYTSDSNANMLRSRLKSWLKQIVVRRFFSRIDAFLCISEANFDYLTRFGARLDRILRMPLALDVSRFSRDAPALGALRDFHFAWAGKLIPVKRPGDFILALRKVAEMSGLETRAIVIGDGPIRDNVMAMAASLPPNCHVEFRGFVNQAAMPGALQSAQTFVFTSGAEPYGMVATEAATSGLALIAAQGIGCVGDTVLARPGMNTLTYPPGDVQALATAMLQLRVREDLLHRMQQASREIACEHNLHAAAAVIEHAVHRVCSGHFTGLNYARTIVSPDSGAFGETDGREMGADIEDGLIFTGLLAERPARVAVVISHPIQHFCPQYGHWAKLDGVRLKVFFASRHGLDSYHDKNFSRTIKWNLKLDFDHDFLPDAQGKAVDHAIDSQDLDARLDAFDPDFVVCYGYAQKLQRRAINWTKGRGKSLLMISDSELHQRRSPVKEVAKKLLLPATLSKVDAFLTVGDSNEAYYRNYGVLDGKLVRSSFPIDVDAFDAALPRCDAIQADVRARHGIPASHLVVLMVGKLIEIKRQPDLIAAAARLRAMGVGVTVLFAGTGELEQPMREQAAREGLDNIVFLGFVMPEALVEYYLGSDVYVHCSSVEPHSLAISEAIYVGLPVVVSDRCGSYGPTDDVRPGLNGFVYPCGDIEELSKYLALLARSPALRARMGGESRVIGAANQQMAHGKALVQALNLVRIAGA